MKVCERLVKQGPAKGQPATGTMAGVRRHHKIRQPACSECRRALERSPGSRSKGLTLKRDAHYRKVGYSYPVKTTYDPRIMSRVYRTHRALDRAFDEAVSRDE